MRAAILSLGVVFLAGAVQATELPPGDPQAGRKQAGACRTCHGLDGFAKIPIAPHIGGEPAAYIEHQLRAFREGTRVHEMMSVVAKNLDDGQIADLAAWYAGHEVTVTLTRDESEAPEACVSCHGVDGIAMIEDAPNLAGETSIYTDTQLKAFRNGKRTHEIMSEVAADMSDADIRAAADWYASVKIEIAPQPKE
ncbi:c-type cytochrome [Labrenzia sp. OB1]|uniref:c-type cytochrome n=1 Tax=Labrenzia sp. OB1 TaxID=1561204 RepID=UPI000B3003BA|nr:c-type cytochrome [Labrenzia sp. OB1]